ncbi:metallophosphoesterase [Jeotgalibacillus marinus]|uniref:Metallophosphoesterase n=1 Tax=Jeotgalibacillus marinus TaxID=86667 RepID=A0ABV3Q2B7_9BACL
MISMTKKISRRSFLKKVAATVLGTGVLGVGGYSYARFIEPSQITLTEITYASTRLPMGFDGLTIAQFSDTHIGFQYTEKQLEKHIKKIQSCQPDMIIFTGDLLDKPNQYKKFPSLVASLSDLDAPLGKYAVYGNHDHGACGTDIYADIMTQSGFTLLRNEAISVPRNDDKIIISGVDDPSLGQPDFKPIEKAVGSESFHILLSHAPDLADIASTFDLQLSGHSHGGQIQLPLFGPLIVPPYAEKYIEGRYDVPIHNRDATIYVNRGLGTTRLPFRLLSIPEITLFTLRKTS